MQTLQNPLPDSYNIERWGMLTLPKSPLCGFTPFNAKHLLVGRTKVLDEGRFTYSYDKVHEVVREALSLGLAISKN